MFADSLETPTARALHKNDNEKYDSLELAQITVLELRELFEEIFSKKFKKFEKK